MFLKVQLVAHNTNYSTMRNEDEFVAFGCQVWVFSFGQTVMLCFSSLKTLEALFSALWCLHSSRLYTCISCEKTDFTFFQRMPEGNILVVCVFFFFFHTVWKAVFLITFLSLNLPVARSELLVQKTGQQILGKINFCLQLVVPITISL